MRVLMGRYGEWEHPEYIPGIDVDTWRIILEDGSLLNSGDKVLLACLKDIGYSATCIQLSNVYGRTWNFYNTHSWTFAKRISQAGYCKPYIRENGNAAWWPILYVGREVFDAADGVFEWTVRPELQEALDSMDVSGWRDELS